MSKGKGDFRGDTGDSVKNTPSVLTKTKDKNERVIDKENLNTIPT